MKSFAAQASRHRVWVAAVMCMVATVQCFARIHAAGPSQVDSDGLTGDAGNMQGGLRSVWLGTHGVAVWLVQEPDSSVRIMGAKFGADGKLLAGPPVALVEDGVLAVGEGSAGLTVSGGELLLSWVSRTQAVLARRLNPNLTWLDASAALLLPPAADYGTTTLVTASNSQRHAVAIISRPFSGASPSFTFVRLGPSSSPGIDSLTGLTPSGTIVATAALAAREDGFLIAWEGADAGWNRTIYARTAGMTGPPGPLQLVENNEVELPSVAYYLRRMSAAPLGNGYAVAWIRPRRPGFPFPEFLRQWRMLDAGGTPLGESQEIFPTDENIGAEAYVLHPPTVLHPVEGGVLAISSTTVPVPFGTPLYRGIRRFISAGGIPGEIGSLGEEQAMAPEETKVYQTGSGLLALGDAQSSGLYSSRHSAVTSQLTPERTWGRPSQVLSQGRPEQQACAVASRGTDFLVVWQDGRDGHALKAEIRGRILNADGVPSGPSFRISYALSEDISPAIAASGGKYLVAWTVKTASNGLDDVMGAFVSGDGVVSTPFALAARTDRDEDGVAVGGGADGGFFAAWRASGVGEVDDIYGAWISSSGTVAPENGFPVGATPRKDRAVCVAGGTSTYAVVWRDGGNSLANVYATLVSAAAPPTPVAPDRILLTDEFPGSAHAPDVAWNGTEYRVVWRYTGIRTLTLKESGAKSLSSVVAPLEPYEPVEPAVVAAGGGWRVFWHESVPTFTPPVHYGMRYRMGTGAISATGEISSPDRFALRFNDGDTLSAATGSDGRILVACPSRGGAWDGAATVGGMIFVGGIELVLIDPARTAGDPELMISQESGLLTLAWKSDPYFPAEAGIIETSAGVLPWRPLPLAPVTLPVSTSAAGASLTIPPIPGNRQFFRLNSFSPP